MLYIKHSWTNKGYIKVDYRGLVERTKDDGTLIFSDIVKRSNIQDYKKKRLATQFPKFFTIDREVR